jgi:hypothetical protein
MPRARPRLYRYFNYEHNKEGEPFALCDECWRNQPRPAGTDLRKIADGAVADCQGPHHRQARPLKRAPRR